MGILSSVGKIAAVVNPVAAVGTGILGSVLGGGSNGIPGNNIPKLADIAKNQTVTDLEKQLKDIPAVAPIDAYKAKAINGPLPEYDLARNKLNEDSNVAGQAGSEALARRFAAMGGGLNSGSFIKQNEIQNDANLNRRSEGMREIGVQEAQAKRTLQEAENQKEYASQESSKQFNASQAFNDKVFRFDSSSKLGQLDLAYKSAELNAATEAYNAELNAYTAKHSGGLLGAGGILGTGIGA